MIKNYTLPVLVLLSGIFLSTISAYYSILGLISIFSGSALLITLMGVGLETAKITSCLWLHKHWKDSIGFLKLYLSFAIIILMIITSLGIYGFLTKANLKQSEGVNLNLAKVTALESNISREQSRLDLNSQQIAQYNGLLSQLTTQDVRRASNERRRIQSEIKVLSKESKEIAKTVDNLNTELLPYKSEINAVEVEVGTLLYISKLIYGDDYKEYLPQTLTVLTLLIIFVFDPLAIGLLIASQKSFGMIPFEDKRSKRNGRLSVSAEHKLREASDPEYKAQMEEARDIQSKVVDDKLRHLLKLTNPYIPLVGTNGLNLDKPSVSNNEEVKSDEEFYKLDEDYYGNQLAYLKKNGKTNKEFRAEAPNIGQESEAEVGELNLKIIDNIETTTDYTRQAWAESEKEDIRTVLNNMINAQEPLGEEFEKVLDDNRWELYDSSGTSIEEGSQQEQSRLPKRRRQSSRKI